MPTDVAPRRGLQDVVAAASGVCYLDGERGVLAYGGYDIHDLAQRCSFEEICHLLWHGRLPDRAELGDVAARLAAARTLPAGVVRLMHRLPAGEGASGGMEVLRTLTSALAHYDPEEPSSSADGHRRRAIRLTGAIASLVATHGRLARGGGPIEPDLALDHAANILYMFTGERPSATAARALDVALILHADHELNASTFAARVTAATKSDMTSAIVAAIGALKGPLHGGANADVMRLLLEIGPDATRSRIEQVIHGKLERKEKIPGFGHRVYRTEDPRATHLRRMSKELGEQCGDTRWFEMSQTIEQLVKAEKRLNANVDFYSATVYHALGLPIEMFTPIFAVSRVAGWTAHVIEQYGNNRLIRPRAEYIGPDYRQPFVPLGER